MPRRVLMLGTASGAPTRQRNHVGFVVRWDGSLLLFDPGEGAQRQLLLVGATGHDIEHICLTHLHGDHCLGLPGVLATLALERVDRPVGLHFPASGAAYVDRLRQAAIFDRSAPIELDPIAADGVLVADDRWTLSTRRLDHSVEAFGYRLEEPPGRTFLPERLAAAGVEGPAVHELSEAGSIRVGGRVVHLEEVSVARPGQVLAVVLDTRVCDAAVALAEGADLLVCESTFLDGEADLAAAYGHLTARQAATIAREAGVGRLVLTHYSQRHPDEDDFRAEAAVLHPDVVAARDLDVIDVPPRRPPEA